MRRTYQLLNRFAVNTTRKCSLTTAATISTTTAATTTGAVYLYSRRNFSQSMFNLYAEENKKVYKGTPPEVDDTHRYVLSENPLKGLDPKNLDITLYQYQVCPFCCKVRAFLDYNKIPYKIVEVNPVLKSEIKFSTQYKKVPIMIINGVQLNDSSVIISSLSELLSSQSTAQRPQDEVHWRKWVDHKLVHTLPPNIYRNPTEAIEAFEYISKMNNFNWYQRAVAKYAGSMAMYGVSKKLKTKHGIDDEREAIYQCANEWMTNIQPNKPYHGGNKPDLADLAVYGVLNSIEGLLTFNDMLAHSTIGDWYMRMKREVGQCSGTQ